VSVSTGRGSTEVKIEPGQFIFGRNSAAKELKGLNPKKIYNRVKKLEQLGNLVIKPDIHYSIITISHWGTYQGNGQADGQATGQPTDRQRTPNGQATDTNKKEENVETVQNGETGKKKRGGRAAPFDPLEADLPFESEQFREAWALWVTHRKEIKKLLTPTSTKQQLSKLKTWGETRAIAAIEHSVAGGYTGCFEPDAKKGTPNALPTGPGQRHPSDVRGYGKF
jgi:hypothetical protein